MKYLILLMLGINSYLAFSMKTTFDGMDINCGAIKKVDAHYCIYSTHGSKNPDVIYHLHGLGLNETSWLTIPLYKAVRATWQFYRYQAPRVVSISFGKSWLVSPKGESPKSGLYEVIMDEVFPFVDRLLPGPMGKKSLIGMSMGGFNGTQIYIRNPYLFEKVALLCPAMATISPYSSKEEFNDYIIRTGASADKVIMAAELTREYFTEQDWERNSPLKVASRTMTRGWGQLYIFAGKRDSFGFYEGDRALFNEGLFFGVPTTWSENEFGHCFFPPVELALFMAKKSL